MLAVSEVRADFGECSPGIFASQEHCEHAWLAEGLAFGFGSQDVVFESERFTDNFFDIS